MNHRIIATSLMVGVLASPATAAGKTRLTLEPSSQWSVDSGPERCSLLRRFGDEKDGVLLEIASFGSRTTFRFTLTGTPVPRSGASRNLAIRFATDATNRETRIVYGESGGLPAALFSGSFVVFDALEQKYSHAKPTQESMDYAARPELIQPDFEAQATTLTAKFNPLRHLVLHIGSMTKPLAELRTCIDSLETGWGLDPAKEQALTRLAVPLPSTVRAIQWNYPGLMLMRGLGAFVPVRVMVGADGQAGTCVVQSENEPAFKAAVCKGLAQKFQPALDADGKPAASVYITNVVFTVN